MTKINWNIADQELKQELVSDDNRWHITCEQKEDGSPKMFLVNYDLLLCPNGTGQTHDDCFREFISSCDKYMERLKRIKQEAQEQLTKILNTTKELDA